MEGNEDADEEEYANVIETYKRLLFTSYFQ